MTDAVCLICGTPEPFEPIYAIAEFRMVRCPTCGLVFQHPQPTQQKLDDSYYHDLGFADALLGDLRDWTVARAGDKARLLTQTAGPLPPGRLLDVGCSSGAWLEVMAEQGWQATGVEIGEQVGKQARERGLDVRTGTLGEAWTSFEPGSFDLVTFWDVLEHLRDPRQELRMAARLLRPGGLIAATLPNVEGLYPRLTYRLLSARLGVWEYPELPVHLYDFSPATIRRLFALCGVQPTTVRTFSLPFEFFLSTTLAADRFSSPSRARIARRVFSGLRRLVYPIANASDRGNQMIAIGRVAGG